jgi:hypothetical protein
MQGVSSNTGDEVSGRPAVEASGCDLHEAPVAPVARSAHSFIVRIRPMSELSSVAERLHGRSLKLKEHL